jgi:hypothetical protein
MSIEPVESREEKNSRERRWDGAAEERIESERERERETGSSVASKFT